MKFDEMQSLFHFVRVLVSFETNQIKVLFLFFISSGLADFFSIGNNKNLPSWIFQNVKEVDSSRASRGPFYLHSYCLHL